MAIDAEELKQRIAQVRAGARISVAPRTVASDVVLDQPPRQGRLAPLYGIPVIGKLARIASGIVNLPKIIENLERHYAQHGAEMQELRAQVADLKRELEEVRRGPSRPAE